MTQLPDRPLIFASTPEAAVEQTAAAELRDSTDVPAHPQRGDLWAVRSLDRAGRVRTRLFRRQPAADRHVEYLRDLGYRPALFVAPVGKWRPVEAKRRGRQPVEVVPPVTLGPWPWPRMPAPALRATHRAEPGDVA